MTCLWSPAFQNRLQGLQDSVLAVPHVVVRELDQTVKIFVFVGHFGQRVGGSFPHEINLLSLELGRAALDACQE